ncbi:MAG TPA: redoxin domain-containing protein [Anaerolineales bacterium]|nr:redoxin domain-containing protein [Anaerolineales bacterium]
MSFLRRLFPASPEPEARPLQPGRPAPDFRLPATGGPIRLSEWRGRPVILAFYPADETPVCGSQLALYNEVLPMFEEFDARLAGISVDSLRSHERFASALGLKFPLLSDADPQGAVAAAYGVFRPKDRVAERALFVIDQEGTIAWSAVSPMGVNPGADGVLQALESLPRTQKGSP